MTKWGTTKIRLRALRGLLIIGIFGFFAFAGIFGFFAMLAQHSPPTSRAEECRQDVENPWGAAQNAATEAVTDELRSPSTASFVSGSFRYRKEGACSFFMTGKLDAQNGFGATIRGSWSAHVTRDDSGHWRASDVSVD